MKKMIRFFFFGFLLSGFIRGQAQSFEGKIIYRNTLESKIPNITDNQLLSTIGDTQEYYIKGGRYKSLMNGLVMQWQLYVPGENRLYNKMSTADVLFWNNGSDNKDSVLSTVLEKNADTILGYPCDKLVLQCLGGVQEYWFNKKVAVADPALFRNHKLANWYYIISQTHALPLKYTLHNPQFVLTSSAVSVTPEKLEDTFFDLPAGVQTQKSDY